jgi:hypothetical protein
MVGTELLIDLVPIVPRMFVAPPMIDAKAPSFKTERPDGLQKSTVGIAGMDPEFDNHTWLQRAY